MTPTIFKFHYYPTKGYACSQAGDNTGYYVTLNDYERLQAHNARLQDESKICGVCFTSSWEPCKTGTPDAIEDSDGGLMACGYCRLATANARLQAELDELRRRLDALGSIDWGKVGE